MKKNDNQEEVILQLAAFFHRNGHVRRQNSARLNAEGTHTYKKGSEIRLTANSEDELTEIQYYLQVLGFSPGTQGKTLRIPVYGKEQVARFLSMVGEGAV